MTFGQKARTGIDAADTVKNIALGLSPWVPRHGDFALEGLSAAELTRAVGSSVPGAQVLEVTSEHDSRGTTDRARLHLKWNEAGVAAGLHSNLFVKGTPSTATSRVLNSAFGLAEYEARFYNEIQPQVADLTMEAHLARSGLGGRYLVLLDDIGHSDDVTFYAVGKQAPLEHTQDLMEVLGKLHGRFWRSPRFEQDLSWVQVYRRRPGYPFAHPILRSLTKRYLAQNEDTPATVRRACEFYVGNRPALDRAWEALPHTLIHGDCHLGNTYRTADGLTGIYDWQNIHKMNGLRDVAYHLSQALPAEVRRANEEDLIRRYLDALAENGAGAEAPSYAEAYDAYRMLVFDGWIAVYTTLAIGGLQPDAGALWSAANCIATMQDLETEQAMISAARRH